MASKKWLLLPPAAVAALALSAIVYVDPYFPLGWEFYAWHFRSLPEVELFHSVYPGAYPARTLMAGYPAGYAASHDGYPVELGIRHNRLTLEPERMEVQCYHPGATVPGRISDAIRTYGCGEDYPDGLGPYAEAFAGLDEVRAFLDAYPGAGPEFVYPYLPGFAFRDGDFAAELAVRHEPGSLEPGGFVLRCSQPDRGWDDKWDEHDAGGFGKESFLGAAGCAPP